MTRILLSNDDGVFAHGLNALAKSIQALSEITIVAPDRDRSGASTSLSLTRPIRIKHLNDHTISVQGTPTDCVHLAITGLLDKMPHMVLSGINAGANLGDDVWYSGTVAAAIEGRFLGLPAIAFSLASSEHKHFDTASIVAKQIVTSVLHSSFAPSTILNVNIPDIPYDDIQGFEVTRLGTRHCAEPTIKQKDPRGNTIYWVGPAGQEADAGEGTDFHAIHNNKVSITPIRIDLTHYDEIQRLSQWVKEL